MRTWLWGVLLATLAAVTFPVRATVVTLDFDSPGGSQYIYNYVEDGFRVHSLLLPTDNGDYYYRGHFDITCAGGSRDFCGPISYIPSYDGTHFLGSDQAGGCQYFDSDGNFVGSGGCQGTIRIDRYGEVFSALDLVNVYSGWTLTSSKGGFVHGPRHVGYVDDGYMELDGSLWRNVEWLEFRVDPMTGAPEGFDNLRLQFAAPEPSTAMLLFAAVVALSAMRRTPRAQVETQ